jgi:hypothetical protein
MGTAREQARNPDRCVCFLVWCGYQHTVVAQTGVWLHERTNEDVDEDVVAVARRGTGSGVVDCGAVGLCAIDGRGSLRCSYAIALPSHRWLGVLLWLGALLSRHVDDV